MKKVIRQQKVDTVDINCVSKEKCYGVRIKGDKGFITRYSYGCGPFTVRSTIGLTDFNGWRLADSENLMSTISILLSNAVTVYEFNSSSELFKWLSD